MSGEKLLDYFQKIQESGQTLLTLLNDLLDLAKMESGKMTFEFKPANPVALITHVVDEFGSLVSERDLVILWSEPDEKGEANIDSEAFKQMIRNLLGNAVKFSPVGGEIEIHMTWPKDKVMVKVRDYGPGIPEGELDAVFDKFVQSSKTNRHAGGTGLGLAICREVISAHQGRIWAENNPYGGARFLFEIPTLVDRRVGEEPVLAGRETDGVG